MEYNARDVFERMAHTYDTPERVENAMLIARAIRENLADTQEKHAMDYGCGTGLVGLALSDRFASMLLVDTAPQMVAQVDEKLRKNRVSGASALCADLTQAALPGITADYVLMSQVLLHVRDYPPLLARLHAMLPPGGHLIIVDFDRNERIVSDKVHNGFDQPALSRLLRQIGFSAVDSRTFHHGEKIFMNQDASLFLMDAVK